MDVSRRLYFEYLIKEYHSLADRLDSYAKSSFEDFKLLAAAGLIVAWPPVVQEFARDGSSFMLFAGFVTVLLTVAAIDARDNLKHSVVRFYMSQAKNFEKEVLTMIGENDAKSFHVVRNWDFWFEKKHKRLVHVFHFMVYTIIIGIPMVVMFSKSMYWYVLAYAATSAAVLFVMLYSVSVLRRPVFD